MGTRKMNSSRYCLLALAAIVAVSAFPSPTLLASTEGKAPAVFVAEMGTSVGQSIKVEVHRDWAPNGADRFYQLIKSGFFKDAKAFRVVPNFVVQFGINADPNVQKMYRGGAANLKDDPVKKQNKKGTLVFATSGPNSRTTQMFINTADNYNLDSMGFAPIGKILGNGMDTVNKMYQGYGEQPDQGQIQMQGNKYLNAQFPKLSGFTSTKIASAPTSELASDAEWHDGSQNPH